MAKEKTKRAHPDWWLLIATIVLICVGIIMVFSSSQYYAQYEYGDSYYYLKAQLTNAAVGAVGMFLAYRMNRHLYRSISYPVYLIILGVLVFMAISSSIATIGGAQRWMEVFGRSVQPSEFAKIALPMALAKWLTMHQDNVQTLTKGFLPVVGLIGLTAGLIFLQKDLSSALVVASAGIVILLCAGARLIHFLSLCGVGVAAAVFAILLEPYRMERIWGWLDPWAYEQGIGWQTVQSLMAIGSGGLTGVGLGSGGGKWFYLPAQHTDFIFSIICEEVGFLGASFVVLLILFIVWRGIMIAVKAPSVYSSLLAIGLISSIGIQSVMNLGVATGLLPVTGITLPFVSYGGTSLIVSMIMIGMLLNISRDTNKG